MNERFHEESYWTEAWIRHIENYMSAPPRGGYWIASQFSRNPLSVLEIAGGSCRDSRYLHKNGLEAVGSDFDESTLAYIEKHYADPLFKLQREDGFSMTFSDNSFDVSFSNGFWVLFPDNDSIHQLLLEQARVTKKTIISLVHNAENNKLVSLFKEKSKEDSLYNIRFFRRDELHELFKSSGLEYKSITMRKFGGPLDRLLASTIKGIQNPLRHVSKYAVPKLYNYQSWQDTERIACVVELK